MPPASKSNPYGPEGESEFGSTLWSVVLAAGHPSSPESSDALASLCETYWYPLYAYARRRLSNSHDAQDVTQEFFSTLLEKNYLAAADPGRGKFRAFLLTAFKNFLSNEWKKARRQKRGGDRVHLSLDFTIGESKYEIEPIDNSTPDQLYDRNWVRALVELTMNRLREELDDSGKSDHLQHLGAAVGRVPISYRDVAQAMGISEGAAKVAAHRLRKRYREILRSEIARTVSSPEHIDDEIRSLFSAM